MNVDLTTAPAESIREALAQAFKITNDNFFQQW